MLALQPRGNGEPVLVLPGFGANNTSTAPLRRYLSWLGYQVQGWTMGRNTGNVRELLPQVVDQVRQLYVASGSPVNLVGWSLGGVIAREVARGHPHTVRQIVTWAARWWAVRNTPAWDACLKNEALTWTRWKP